VILVVLCGVVLVSPLAAGRWPTVLVRHFRLPWVIWCALVVQTALLVSPLPLPQVVASSTHIATYALALAFLLANLRAPGIRWLTAGACTNGITIAANGGTLPASRWASDVAGLAPRDGFTNSGVLDDPVVPWLGDVFAWPAPLPLANTFSVGDVLLVVGVAVATWSSTRRVGTSLPDARGIRAGALGSRWTTTAPPSLSSSVSPSVSSSDTG
jgi:hypothetical protein